MANVRNLADFHPHLRATTGCGSISQRLTVIAIDIGCKLGVLRGHLHVFARETEFLFSDGCEGLLVRSSICSNENLTARRGSAWYTRH
jgi:hypothetical protein